MRLEIDPTITCSDASMEGGGMCVSIGVSNTGVQVLATIGAQDGIADQTTLGRIPFLSTRNILIRAARVDCVGLFDGPRSYVLHWKGWHLTAW